MTDHHLRAVELLDEAECLRSEVEGEYAKPIHDKRIIGDRLERMRFALDRAKIHAHLAESEQLRDIWQLLDHRFPAPLTYLAEQS